MRPEPFRTGPQDGAAPQKDPEDSPNFLTTRSHTMTIYPPTSPAREQGPAVTPEDLPNFLEISLDTHRGSTYTVPTLTG